MLTFLNLYEGEFVLMGSKPLEITGMRKTEPDGEGGFLYDLWLKDYDGVKQVAHNMSTNIIEKAIDADLDLATQADYCEHCDKFGCRI